MKHIVKRAAAMLLTLSVLFACLLPAVAADDYRETRPGNAFSLGPQWTEIEISCSSGGHTLRGTMTCPKEISEEMPVAILLHGLCTDRSWCDDMAWCLAEHGIVSVRFDYYGTGESDGEETDMSVSTELRDTVAILDYVEGLKFTDRDNIFLVGKSMGGLEALLTADARGEEINALCLFYPALVLPDSVRHGYLLGSTFTFDPGNLPETLAASSYTFGRSYLSEMAALDIDSIAGKCRNPVLIIHGDADYVAPISYSEAVAEKYDNYTLHVMPGGGHGFGMDREYYALDDMVHFIERNLK